MISPTTAAIRLLIAFVLGAAIGFERERGERGAGPRMVSLVSLASALIAIVSGHGFLKFLSLAYISLDPSRVAARTGTGLVRYVVDLNALEGLDAIHVDLDLERFGSVPAPED